MNPDCAPSLPAPDFTTRLLMWADGGVSEFLSNACLVTGVCYQGAWFTLDVVTLRQLGRIWYVEQPRARAERRRERRELRTARRAP